MSVPQRILWSQVRIGLVVSLVLTLGSLAVFFIDETRRAIDDRYTLYFHTFTTQTLRPKAPVWLAGQPVGQVTSIRFEPPSRGRGELLHVELSINALVQPMITEGAAAQVITSGLIGEAVVNIVPAREAGASLPDLSNLPTAAEIDPEQILGRLRELSDSIRPVAERWRRVLDVALDGPGTVTRFVRRPSETRELVERFDRMSQTFEQMSSVAAGFSSVFADPEVQAALERISPRLEQLASDFQAGGGSVGAFTRDSAFATHLDRMATTVTRINERLASGRGTLGRLMHDRALATELTETRELLRGLRAELQAGGGDRPPR